MSTHYSYLPITDLDQLQAGDVAVIGRFEHKVVEHNGVITVWVEDPNQHINPLLCAQLGAEFRRPQDLDPLPIHPGVIITIWRERGAEMFICLGNRVWSPIENHVTENALFTTAQIYGASKR